MIDMIIANIHHNGVELCHNPQVPTSNGPYSTHTHTCSLTSLARKRTAFYAYSERQNEPYAKLTALNRSYRWYVQWLHQVAYKASGP